MTSGSGWLAGIGRSLAILRRFWAVAARRNSSRAPFGPRRRSRSSFRMRLRCANSISIVDQGRKWDPLYKRSNDLLCLGKSELGRGPNRRGTVRNPVYGRAD
jgi:hypothetical protein